MRPLFWTEPWRTHLPGQQRVGFGSEEHPRSVRAPFKRRRAQPRCYTRRAGVGVRAFLDERGLYRMVPRRSGEVGR